MYLVTKKVGNFSYYAHFTQAPLHYQYCKWEGLKENATSFKHIYEARAAMLQYIGATGEAVEIINTNTNKQES
jgi:hypothetical protein